MGSGVHDDQQTRSFVSSRRASGRGVMQHNDTIAQGGAVVVHPKLDPKLPNRDGLIVRESRDSTEHPASTPIAVFFDTTGSMGHIPGQLVEKLGTLMQLMNQRNYVTDPQVLFGAINDVQDHSLIPLEVGQFESSNEMDEVITNIYSAQSGGGGNYRESYELAFYFMARKAVLDSVEKRQKKGYFFMIGDEAPYAYVSKNEVKRVIGDDIEANIPVEDILEELREKFEVYWIMPNTMTSRDRNVQATLNRLFGERILRIENPEEISEFIAATIARAEGRTSEQIQQDLAAEGASAEAAQRAAAAAEAAANIPPRLIDPTL